MSTSNSKPATSRPTTSRACSLLSVLFIVTQSGCVADVSETGKTPTPELAMTPLVDVTDDPDVVEVKLIAAAGSTQYLPEVPAEIWGYRDGSDSHSKVSIPGPRLEVDQGQQVIVHLENQLPEATSIHWHRLRVPNASDGTPSVQVSVQPGGSYDYRFKLEATGKLSAQTNPLDVMLGRPLWRGRYLDVPLPCSRACRAWHDG